MSKTNLSLKVEKLVPGGQALATHPDGRKIFLWNALPGEIVSELEITKQKSHYYEAIATQIAHPSSHRIEPKDPCYLATSPWQILDFAYELEQKSALVQEIFREHKISIPTPEIHTDHREFFYRNKMEYSLYWDNDSQKIDLAFHARGSHRKLSISQSSLEHPVIFSKAQTIVDQLNANHEPARKYQSLLLRANQNGEVSGGLYENGQPHPTFPPLKDTILDHTYQYSPNGFFQINLPVYELALKLIKSHIKTTKVLDLYSGVGTIGLSVARDRNLTLVESDGFAFRELLQNLPNLSNSTPQSPTPSSLLSDTNLLKNPHSRSYKTPTEAKVATSSGTISAYLTKSEQALDFITSDATVILDPPRAGCHPDVINKLLSVRPPLIIYLSCNPATQARDLEPLLELYHLETVQTFNFFPRTPHIENLVILSL